MMALSFCHNRKYPLSLGIRSKTYCSSARLKVGSVVDTSINVIGIYGFSYQARLEGITWIAWPWADSTASVTASTKVG